jgi:hypothetical protein
MEKDKGQPEEEISAKTKHHNYAHAQGNLLGVGIVYTELAEKGQTDHAKKLLSEFGPNIVNFTQGALKESIQKLIDEQNE